MVNNIVIEKAKAQSIACTIGQIEHVLKIENEALRAIFKYQSELYLSSIWQNFI